MDDESAIQRNVTRILSVGAPNIRLTCASDGAEALRVLEQGHVDLLITSLAMPVIDGVELLRHLANRRVTLPVIVMTEHGPAPAEARPPAGCRVEYLREPLEREHLLRRVHEHLSARPDPARGGVTLVDLLVLLRMERRSCALRVTAGAEQGTLFFSAGALIDARHGELVGMSAAVEILGWHEPVVVVDMLVRARTATLFATLGELMEAVRLAEERRRAIQLGVARGGVVERVPGPPIVGATTARPPFLSLVPATWNVDEVDEVDDAAAVPDTTPGPAPAHAEAVWERRAVQARISAAVAAALEIDGATAAALASWEFDRSLAPLDQADHRRLEVVVAGHCRVMRVMAAMMMRLGVSGTLRDILLTCEDGRSDILAPLPGDDGLFLWVEIDQRRSSLALAHRRVQKLIGELAAPAGLCEVLDAR